MKMDRTNPQTPYFLMYLMGVFVLGLAFLSACTATPVAINSGEKDRFTQEPLTAAITLPPIWTPTMTQPPSATPTESLDPEQEATPPSGFSTPVPMAIVTTMPRSSDLTGWQRVETKLVAFWLPGSFEIIDLGDSFGEFFSAFFEGFAEGMGDWIGEISAELDGEGATPEPINLDDLDGTFEFDFLMAIDEDLLTSVFMISQPRESGNNLENYLHEALSGIEGDFTLLSLQAIEDAPYEMGRAIVEMQDPDTHMTGNMLMYVILGADNAWTLNFIAADGKFEQLLPIFEKSVESFTIKP